MQLSVAMSFSGQRDIAWAARQIAEKAAQGLLDPAEVHGVNYLLIVACYQFIIPIVNTYLSIVK